MAIDLNIQPSAPEDLPTQPLHQVEPSSGDDHCPVMKSKQIDEEIKPTKQDKKKRKQRKKKKRQQIEIERSALFEDDETDDNVEVEYVQEVPTVDDLDPMYRQYARIFEAFKLVEPEPKTKPQPEEEEEKNKGEPISQYPPPSDMFAEEGTVEKPPENGPHQLSKRKLKRLNRLSVAELKQLVNRPDVVEMHDVTARDPKLLVQLKAYRNSVPIPRHWCFRRKYLSGKRGIEKPPFELPDYIKRTGIVETRALLQERDEAQTLKSKMRDRARPKLGKTEIDYQKLHDAFFKWQIKPPMTMHGELYYEGKEFENKHKDKKPGEISDALRTALGMPIGSSCSKVPPPWLIAMQRYGPPPSYPNLKIPGLNSPIPEGCAFGYHAGGWGKPPVDGYGRPLYGDVFGVQTPAGGFLDDDVERGHWGEPESSSSEEEEEEEEEDGEEEEVDASGLVTPAEDGLETPSGTMSVSEGLETPDTIELRKRKVEIEKQMDSSGEPASLYTVLQEKRTEGLGSSMMGSTHVYDMTGAGGQAPPSVVAARRGGAGATVEKARNDEVEVALDPSELDLDSEAMASRYEETMRSRQKDSKGEDLSDMLKDHLHKQKGQGKRKKQQNYPETKSKKYKEFKF